MTSTLVPVYSPRENRILAALTAEEYARLVNDLELVTLPLGHILYMPGDRLEFAYFPINCIVSLVFTTANGASAELAVTGNDGLVGIPLVLGGETTTHKAVVQGQGQTYRLRAEMIRWELGQNGNFQRVALCYAQALMTQIAQSVVCNRHHTIDQQLCRWLLLSLDQLPDNHLYMTQELIANMLGVRREAVTEAAGKLQTANLIQYSRGHITVIDRAGLEARACECYRVVRSEYERLFLLMPAIAPKPHWISQVALRYRAEKHFLQMKPPLPDTQWDRDQLLRELQVRQIELEMSNEELHNTHDEANALREKYADIYDFAPIAYVTLDVKGVIIQLNLAGAILLGVKRSQYGRYRFVASVMPEFQALFKQFHEEVLRGEGKKLCEVRLLAIPHRIEMKVRIEAISDENCCECRMVVMEVSAEKSLKS